MNPELKNKEIEMRPGLLRMPDRTGALLDVSSFFSLLSEALERKQVEWAVLRNAEDLPENTRNDIDLLILPADQAEVIRVVERCAEQSGWCIAGRIHKHGYTSLLLKKKSGEKNPIYVPIDLFTALEFRGLRYLAAETVLKNRTSTQKGVWTIPDGISAAITLLKEWLPHGELSEAKRTRIIELAKNDPSGFDETMESAVGLGWADRIERGEWTLSVAEHRMLRRAVRKRSPGWQREWLFSAWANVVHLFRPSLGMVVCLAGADGSGKTTLAQGLVEKTYGRPFKGCRYIHGNIGVLPRFRDMRRALGIGQPAPEPEKEILQGMMEPIPAWKSVLLASYYAIDFFLARILIRRWRGQWLLTVMDRSFYDYTYQLGHRNCPRWALRILSILIPKPDLLLCVEGDAAAIHARKPELTVEEIQIEQNILRELSARLPFARILNGRDGVEAMVDAGAKQIFQTLENKMLVGATDFQCLEMGGKPLAALPSGSRNWKLFPATSLKRAWLRNVLCALAVVGLDRLFCSRCDPDLISEEEVGQLLDRLTEFCSGEQPSWLLAWPAQVERKRMYIIFRCASKNISGVVKIGAGEFNRGQFANEAEVLRRLVGKELSFSIPSVLFQCDLDENRAALALGNFPLRAKRFHPEAATAAGRQVMTALKQRVGGLTHGDLGAANMLRSDEGRLFVLDWENASDQAPRLTDSVGLWLSAHQSQILREKEGMCHLLRQTFSENGELLAALQFLSDRDNLAAKTILEGWGC